MPHYLMQRTVDDGKPHAHANPFMVSMRYQCECTGGEVLQISVVIDLHLEEEAFVWTMMRLFRDMKIEINQHLERPKPIEPQELVR